ncbi:MAG: hypothetical protein ACJAY3_000146, partial [Neolewinella sp.]
AIGNNHGLGRDRWRIVLSGLGWPINYLVIFYCAFYSRQFG